MGLLDGFQIGRQIAAVNAPRPQPGQVARALERLRAFGKESVPKIVDALPSDNGGHLAGLLGELVTNTTLKPVVERGLFSEDPQVVAAVKRALLAAKQLDPNRVFDLYVGRGGSVVNIADYLVARKDAVSAKTVLRVLEIAREDAQPELFRLIDQLATPAIVSVLVGFLKTAEWQGRAQIAATIARFPGDAVRDALVRLLADPSKVVRQSALEGIAAIGMPVPIGEVIKLLRDPDLVVQAKAIETAVRLRDPGAVPHLVAVLQDESEHVRRAAVEVLNAVGDTGAIKDLFSALKDQDWWVRVRAADALGAIGGPAVIDAVLRLLDDDDEFMRRTAVEILNTTKDERAFHYLLKALRDPDWWVRERAIDALANLGDRRAVPALIGLLEQDNQATPVAIRALVQLGDP
jgi:serine/threonine-protein kinase